MVKKLLIIGILMSVVLVITVVGGKKPETSENGKKNFTTSIYPIYYLTSRIVGDRANVKMLIPQGAEPHEYEPTSENMVDVSKSDLLIINGGIEPWLDKMDTTKKLVVGNDLIQNNDPHIWLDPILAINISKLIFEEVARLDPVNQDFYSGNFNVLSNELNQLDTDFRNGLRTCAHRTIVTSHEAFGYVALRYALIQKALVGIDPEIEPTAKDISVMTDFVKKEKIPVIYFENLVDPKMAKILAENTGAKTLALNPVEGITDSDKKLGENYFTIQRSNLVNLRIGLACQ